MSEILRFLQTKDSADQTIVTLQVMIDESEL